MDYVDLFAGPGGWDVAARELGLDGVGIELDPSACATRDAAGLRTVFGSVLEYSPAMFRARGLIASAPCQTFSTAGNGAGRQALGSVLALSDKVAEGANPSELGWGGDPRTVLVLEPLWWAVQALAQGHPFRWIALEQVPPVLPVWERFAVHLRGLGYTVVTGVLNAEAYGVPQTRRRAVLVARLSQPVALPTHTHSRYYPRTPDKLDPGVPRWVSMAEALTWGSIAKPSFTVCAGNNGKQSGAEWGWASARESMLLGIRDGSFVLRSNYSNGSTPGERGERGLGQPASIVTTKACSWANKRPATTVLGTYRVGQPGHKCMTNDCHPERGKSLQYGADSIRVSVEEAAALQTFPPGYPWQGTKTKRYEQVGNAVPPLLAWHVLKSVVC